MGAQAYVNGKIVTVDEMFSVREAVAAEDGRITAVGTTAEILTRAGRDAEVTDLQGATVIPGLIDNHNHFVRATEHWASEVRLDGVTARGEVLRLLKDKAKGLNDGEWLLTLGGWHTDQLHDDRTDLSLAEIDDIAAGHPAFIQVGYSHAFVSSALLAAVGDQIAGLVRDASGRPTGRVNGGIVSLNAIAARFPRPSSAAARADGVRAAAAYYNSLGLTSVFDPGGVGVSDEAYKTIENLTQQNDLTIRVQATMGDAANAQAPEQARAMAARVRASRPFQGNEWYGRIAVGEVYYAPFHWDHPAIPPQPKDEDVAAADEILRAAAECGWPVQTHSVTGEGLDLVLAAYERASHVRPIRPLRWCVTHAEGITAAQLEVARRHGVTVQVRSMGVIGGQQHAESVYGAAALHRMPPLRQIADSGITWGLGTDGSKAAQLNPFVSLWWATTGMTLGGDVAVAAELVLSREEALIAHTRANAWLMFQEGYTGSIRPGLRADMVVLDRDYLTVPADEIKDIRPIATLVDGRTAYGTL